VRVLLYRADLTLETFPDQTNWRFLSTTPFSQLLRRLNYPLPVAESNKSGGYSLGDAPDITNPQNPPRVIHLIAEIIDGAARNEYLLPRYSGHPRALEQTDPETHAQLMKFLSSPSRPLPGQTAFRLATTNSVTQRAYPQAPFLLDNAPTIARLTLPEGRLFVRPVFGKLLDGILRDLPDKKKAMFVTGTAGTGKTAFLWYVFHALCNRGRCICKRHLAPPMDIVLDVPGLFIMIDTAGSIFTGPRDECFRVELLKKETLYFADLAHRGHDKFLSGAYASRLLVGLPCLRVDPYIRFNTRAALRLLPLWRDRELELCRRACFPALDKALVVARTKLWGRQPLWTLAMDPADGVGEQRFAELIHAADFPRRAMEICEANQIRVMMSFRSDASRLLVVRRPPVDSVRSYWQVYSLPQSWRFGWCSPAVRDAAFQLVCADHTMPASQRERSLEYIRATGWDRSRLGRNAL
jgi:hypothetical protein